MNQSKRPLALVVDDEKQIRRINSVLLRSLGYDVLTAQDGRHAEKVFREHAQAISLVILDLRLPDIGGMEMLGKLREIKPSIRVILATGDTDAQTGAEVLLRKPFGLAELKDVLERRG